MIKLAYERVFNKLSNRAMIICLFRVKFLQMADQWIHKNTAIYDSANFKARRKEFHGPKEDQSNMHNKIQPDWPNFCVRQLRDRIAIDRFQNFFSP